MNTSTFNAKAARLQLADESSARIPLLNSSHSKAVRFQIPLEAKHQSQADFFALPDQNDVTFVMGPAGTGKTFLAIAKGLIALKTGEVKKLILSRPAIEAGEKLGFLPGDMKEKVDPYLRPCYDEVTKLIGSAELEKKIASGEIEIAPIAFMRGRTLADAYIILDEAQNTTVGQMNMFTTRLGWGSTMIICGDPDQQVDLPLKPGELNGLQDAIIRHQGTDGIAFHTFDISHVVRHPTVAKLAENYKKAITAADLKPEVSAQPMLTGPVSEMRPA